MSEPSFEKGFLAIKLIKLALTINPETLPDEEDNKELKKAWTVAKKLLTIEEIEVFKEMLKHYRDE